jgi:hypothetical protein
MNQASEPVVVIIDDDQKVHSEDEMILHQPGKRV